VPTFTAIACPSTPVSYGTLLSSSSYAVNTVSGSRRTLTTSLSYATTPVLNAPVLFTIDLHPAGSFADTDAFSASMSIQFERLSADCDLHIALCIGTNIYIVVAQDDGLYQLAWGTYTSGDTHATRPTANRQQIATSTTTEPETVALVFSWPASSGDGSVSITLTNGFTTTHTMTGVPRPTFSSAVTGMLLADDNGESYGLDSLTYNGLNFTGAQMGGSS